MSQCTYGEICDGDGNNCITAWSSCDGVENDKAGNGDADHSGRSYSVNHNINNPKSLADYGLKQHSDKEAAKSTPYYFEIYSDDSDKCKTAKEVYNLITQNMLDSNQKFLGPGDVFLGIILETIIMKRSISKIRTSCTPLAVDVLSDKTLTTPLTKIHNKTVLKTIIGFILHSPYTYNQLHFIQPEIRGSDHFVFLKSEDKKYSLIGQNDGNLVIYGPRGAIWCTGHRVYQRSFGKCLFLSHDGKLHWSWGDEKSRWSSTVKGPNNGAPYKLLLSNDGNMIIKDKKNCILWVSGG